MGVSAAWLGQVVFLAVVAADGGVIELSVGETTARLLPEAGANVFSLKHAGTEYLLVPDKLEGVKGFRYGTPILYPTPNRVAKGTFTFGDVTATFPPNDGANFLHGLVHSAPFEVVDVKPSDEEAAARLRLEFKPGKPWFDQFPFPHELRLTIRVKNGSVRWEYAVVTPEDGKPTPFGFALHPWFLYLNDRAATYLTIPAEARMEATSELLPTGKLLELADTPFDFRSSRPIGNLFSDDVFFRMKAGAPTVIDFREAKKKLFLRTTDDFTHLVLYTPLGKPFFCVENQTCSTDAHNLASRHPRPAHLQVIPPGKTHTGAVEFSFGP